MAGSGFDARAVRASRFVWSGVTPIGVARSDPAVFNGKILKKAQPRARMAQKSGSIKVHPEFTRIEKRGGFKPLMDFDHSEFG